MRFNKKSVGAVAASDVREETFWDDRISGFGVKVTLVGLKVYVYRHLFSKPRQGAQTPPQNTPMEGENCSPFSKGSPNPSAVSAAQYLSMLHSIDAGRFGGATSGLIRLPRWRSRQLQPLGSARSATKNLRGYAVPQRLFPKFGAPSSCCWYLPDSAAVKSRR